MAALGAFVQKLCWTQDPDGRMA